MGTIDLRFSHLAEPTLNRGSGVLIYAHGDYMTNQLPNAFDVSLFSFKLDYVQCAEERKNKVDKVLLS